MASPPFFVRSRGAHIAGVVDERGEGREVQREVGQTTHKHLNTPPHIVLEQGRLGSSSRGAHIVLAWLVRLWRGRVDFTNVTEIFL